MQKWVLKILLLIPILTIIGHSFLPHHHREELQEVAHHHHHDKPSQYTNHHQHHENKEDGQNLFSFSQLDENFVRAKFQDINLQLPIAYLLIPAFLHQYNQITEQSKTYFGHYKEYPPPDNYLSEIPSRGPPSSSSMV